MKILVFIESLLFKPVFSSQTSTLATITQEYIPCEREDIFELECGQDEFRISLNPRCYNFQFGSNYLSVQFFGEFDNSTTFSLQNCAEYFTEDGIILPFEECGSYLEVQPGFWDRFSYRWKLNALIEHLYVNETGEYSKLKEKEETAALEFECSFQNGDLLNSTIALDTTAITVSSNSSQSRSFFDLQICSLEITGACDHSNFKNLNLGQLMLIKPEKLVDSLDYRIESLTASSGDLSSSVSLIENGCALQEVEEIVTIDEEAKTIILKSFSFANSKTVIFEVSVGACSKNDEIFCQAKSDCQNQIGNKELLTTRKAIFIGDENLEKYSKSIKPDVNTMSKMTSDGKVGLVKNGEVSRVVVFA
ncbi:Oidioi.mRNA.OKI2018_I69.chr2.g4977.t1.cds [Oikopleura dioica]|uniref:Oidioi.mRNA.OKI2018_I69.chr2.g4977.t1.cds n=1 Tax=Oikopleura dioica TaxID=34765 RepID=A0ABN7T4L3_OIKDI|nr:Oidioi.mRNA.OKI2018_I69.chr2.g4977.t1.cds [Oikopleura dioica]